MAIERDFLDGDGTLPILFRVSETFEVWDGHVALLLDHLLNHIKTLSGLADGPADQSVLAVLAQYPHYRTDRRGFLEGASRESVARTLIEECLALLKCLSMIAPITEIEEPKRGQLLEAVRQRVPFLDYHYVDELSISDARREG